MSRKKINKKAFQKRLAIYLKTVGDNLYDCRAKRKETLQTVAKSVKMNPGSISKIEKGLSPRFRITTLLRLCKYYSITLYDVFSPKK